MSFTRFVLALLLAVSAFAAPAEAANIPKIKNVRVRDTDGAGNTSYRIEVAATGDATAQAWVTVETDQNRTFTLKPEALTRRASLEVYAGEIREKGFTVVLDLTDANGKPLFTGTAQFAAGVLHGRWDGKYTDGKQPGFWVGAVQLHPTETKGRYGVAFTLVGEGASTVSSGLVRTYLDRDDFPNGTPAYSKTPVEPSTFTDERIFSAPVRFDGDPVGASYELDVQLFPHLRIADNMDAQRDRLKSSIELIQLPAGPCGGPERVMSVYGNGKGTRAVATGSNGKPGLL